jgi:hypothetical protein
MGSWASAAHANIAAAELQKCSGIRFTGRMGGGEIEFVLSSSLPPGE